MPTLPYGTAFTIGRFDGALVTDAPACDLRPLAFIDAYGLVGTACALLVARRTNPELRIQVPASAERQRHLAAMGLAEVLSESHSQALPEVRVTDAPDVVVPLRRASDSGGAQMLSNPIWEQLHENVNPQVLTAIAEGVWEMVANALEHSGSDALIMGQIYRIARGGLPPDHDDRVQVVIGDVGQGIRSSFLATGAESPRDDLEAIVRAMEYLVTSVRDDRGRGQGLSTTMELVTELRGKMVVRSGEAKITIDSRRRREQRVAALPGTIVALSLPL